MKHPSERSADGRRCVRGAGLLVAAATLLAPGCDGCGGAGSAPPTSEPTSLETAPAPAAMEARWSIGGRVSRYHGTAIGERTVFAIVSRELDDGSYERRVWAIDRETGRVTFRAVNRDAEIVRVDPLLLYHVVEGEAAGEPRRSERITRLTDALEPRWDVPATGATPPREASGPLVIVSQMEGEHFGIDPEDGRLAFRVRGEWDSAATDGGEAESFVAVPVGDDRTALLDRDSGELITVLDVPDGTWQLIGDRLVAYRYEDRALVAYDREGGIAWRRTGGTMHGLTALATNPDDRPGLADQLRFIEPGRGLVSIDADGQERWTHAFDGEGYVSPGPWHEGEGWLLLGGEPFLDEDPPPTIFLDSETGERRFACDGRCDTHDLDERQVLLSTGEGDAASLELRGADGALVWRRPFDETTSVEHGTAALLEDRVAVCRAGGPVTFLHRADGRVLSTHPMPSLPEDQNVGSPSCSLHAAGDRLLAFTEQSVTLFAPAGQGDAEASAEPVEASGVADAPEERPFYDVAALAAPPAADADTYAAGRAAYLEARGAFREGRFAEAARGFLAAYRAYTAASDSHVDRLGYECCYDARVAADRAGGGEVYHGLLAELRGESHANCRGLVERGPPPF